MLIRKARSAFHVRLCLKVGQPQKRVRKMVRAKAVVHAPAVTVADAAAIAVETVVVAVTVVAEDRARLVESS
jgi:hypothetical protein